jgi:hypothetical protein
MKKLNMRYIFALALLILAVAGCKDDDFDNYKIQSVDNHGKDQNMVSTAVTATSNSEFIAYSVDASTDEGEIKLIPVVLTAKDVASRDIHVKFVPAPDSLDAYNTANETAYIMPGAEGTPAFTLLDDGVATIPKGSSVGYLKIKTVTNDYFGDNQYAFAYRIESVQEPGYTISGNHNFGIAAVIPKNDFDGVYELGPGRVERFTAGTQNVGDPLQGDFTDLGPVNLVTTGKYTLAFGPLWATGDGVGGIDGTYIQIDPTPGPDGKFPVSMHSLSNPTLTNTAGEENSYDPATKTFQLAFHWGSANKRTYKATLAYVSPRP